ncbi:serine hydrolase [Polluticaenibacter yanchengensis]|uniref:Serine hydrolase n=1 Tax=Polluticaenibacter yanchengensis TaxID=3014562 RepID=A0ABT4ULS8_9BACT|nr:serine hydrolase [Chitinophagaceae bacterium LY-5]
MGYTKWILAAGLLAANFTYAQKTPPITSAQIDSVVALTLKTFNVPGIAVGVVKDNVLIHAKGYGVRSIVSNEKVNEHTLFGVASHSKAFTAAALAILVDEKKIRWEDKVVDYIPYFKMYNPYVTQEVTIRDLLSHRTGLGLGAGDLMFWPDSGSISKQEIIHNVRFLKENSPFRTKYTYNNVMYMIAGEIVAKVSGQSWEDFVETRILQPAGMKESAVSLNRVRDKSNIITGHAPYENKLLPVRFDWNPVVNAAGGLVSNVVDMSKWAILQLNSGKINNQQIFSTEQCVEMHAPVSNIPVKKIMPPYNTHFSGYALGWQVSDVKGYKQVTHTGGLAGCVTQTVLFPELGLGIIVLTNQQSGLAFNSISYTIKDAYLGITGQNRVAEFNKRQIQQREETEKAVNPIYSKLAENALKSGKANHTPYPGTYTDLLIGEVIIEQTGNHLFFKSAKSPRLKGELFYYEANTYVIKWDDRSFDADAFVRFQLNENNKATSFTIDAFSPMTDFSFDFQDLNFVRK